MYVEEASVDDGRGVDEPAVADAPSAGVEERVLCAEDGSADLRTIEPRSQFEAAGFDIFVLLTRRPLTDADVE